MPIKNSTTGQIPYLERYTPYSLSGAGILEVTNIADMITYDITPNFSPTSIQYKLGSRDLYVRTLNIKNITNNADIETIIQYPRTIFFLNIDGELPTRNIGTDLTEVVKILKPFENVKIDIILNNSYIDLSLKQNALADIKINFRNLMNNRIITKNSTVETYQPQFFPRRVRIE